MTNDTKYGKYIVTDYLSDEEKIARGRTPDKREEGVPFGNGLVWLDEKIVKDAFYMEVVLLEPGSKSSGVWVKPHTHDKDEIIGFIGTNVRNPRSLDAEIELWLGDEKHISNQNLPCLCPKGFGALPPDIQQGWHSCRPFLSIDGRTVPVEVHRERNTGQSLTDKRSVAYPQRTGCDQDGNRSPFGWQWAKREPVGQTVDISEAGGF